MNSAPAPVTASLDDPFYYLTNFRFVLAWVSERHADLLDPDELAFLRHFDTLPQASQALLARMVMRKGELFRLGKLSYREIGDTSDALAPLVELGWVDAAPTLSVDELFHQLRLAELRSALATPMRDAGLPASAGKAVLQATLTSQLTEIKSLTEWWPMAPDNIVRLMVMDICDRLRLMFFGNLRQDWAEFVLTELGLQQFESVPFTTTSRAFQQREEVNAYLALHRLRQRLDEGEPFEQLSLELPPRPGNAWLATRRARLLLQLGREAERSGQAEQAVLLYAKAESSEARIRQLRVLERLRRHQEAFDLAMNAQSLTPNETEAQALARLLPRLRKKLKIDAQPPVREPAYTRWELTLPGPQPVERAVALHIGSPEAPVYYTENTLITGLFGLLCWPAIFAPLPGAFFHPFHSGPADLHREDFVARRRGLFDECLARLEDGSYRQAIHTTWQEKHGLASPFVHWPLLDETLLALALECLPATHLKACFGRLLQDIKANRAGLPDLIQFLPDAPPSEPRYRLIEVKGPGDRLQDNQRRWLAFFHQHHIPVAVCYVQWLADSPAAL
ncbi:VRR-NUC domain-containing protein [Vreelandella populi]|uniref:phosphodiesterase I n=1 Tax=Vreelandella populi TaxID=2498858 RepID=A0A3S0YLC6_9GAMM|nr:VRR-NUC domain-containing protein [Halomonas populi]RUR41242.1 VRR-NUC domain-containing protein [Halomonas populi]RUR44353.1 VRR-NUC domain-containing protein [Halomonas populi]